MSRLAKVKEIVSRKFIWTLLFFLCSFGLTAWLFTVENGADIAGILALAVAIIALIVNPTDSRLSVWIAMGLALLFVVLGAAAYSVYEQTRSLQVVADVKFSGATSELRNEQKVAMSIATTQERDYLTIRFGITNSRSGQKIQDCRTDPETKVDLKLDSDPSPITLSSDEPGTVAVHGAREINAVVTMRARDGCRMQLHVDSAELHN
ncbi:hypothetical protein [Saccharopolyspora phatthalungensis]|uniref:Membrane-bound ClpP family serine protease n=1 Tax=Saccharopolyspora phatthalungensis TaxID=664693 RepID=A0A840PXN4_9PSEU|nr:hypothetical protein [Saccharopolyspora phatthalungensis]MBB5155042.1 membrane-bound ClpP family serine protease [Saccharopolyspora phatthalungensis]